eukprot:SAG11_NODE_11473_length_758_cov_1.977238_1_plen_37_part_01
MDTIVVGTMVKIGSREKRFSAVFPAEISRGWPLGSQN